MTHPLRDLAAQLLRLTQEHPAYSQAISIVTICADHLNALAGTHEANQHIAGLEKQNYVAVKTIDAYAEALSGKRDDGPERLPGKFPWKTVRDDGRLF